MGTYGYSTFEITFPDQAALDTLIAELRAHRPWMNSYEGFDNPAAKVLYLVFGSEGESLIDDTADGLTVYGWTSDHVNGAYNLDYPQTKRLTELGVKGHIDWQDDGEPDDRWRIRWYGDPDRPATSHQATVLVTYPDDPEANPDDPMVGA